MSRAQPVTTSALDSTAATSAKPRLIRTPDAFRSGRPASRSGRPRERSRAHRHFPDRCAHRDRIVCSALTSCLPAARPAAAAAAAGRLRAWSERGVCDGARRRVAGRAARCSWPPRRRPPPRAAARARRSRRRPPPSRRPCPAPSPRRPLPWPVPPVGGAALGGCGDVLPPGAPPLPPDVVAAGFVLADLDSGAVLAARAPHARQRPASTLKVLTAMVAIDRLNPDATVAGAPEDLSIDGSRAGIGPGRHLHGAAAARGDAAQLRQRHRAGAGPGDGRQRGDRGRDDARRPGGSGRSTPGRRRRPGWTGRAWRRRPTTSRCCSATR